MTGEVPMTITTLLMCHVSKWILGNQVWFMLTNQLYNFWNKVQINMTSLYYDQLLESGGEASNDETVNIWKFIPLQASYSFVSMHFYTVKSKVLERNASNNNESMVEEGDS